MDSSDRFNKEAGVLWSDLLEKEICLSTSNYIVVETMALLQNRLGFDAAVLWYQDILGLVEVLWVEETVHQGAYELWFSIGKRKLSLVDCTSFSVMRLCRIETVFGFDAHFTEQGFKAYSIRDIIINNLSVQKNLSEQG